MKKIKTTIITGISILAFIGICAGIAYFQGKDGIGVPVDTRKPRLLSEEEERLYEELDHEWNIRVLDMMLLEENKKQRDALAAKKNPSEHDMAMIKSYDAYIAELTQEIADPSTDELRSRIDELLYE